MTEIVSFGVSMSFHHFAVVSRLDNGEQQTEFLSYPAYIATSKQQIAFARDVRNLLNQAASDVVNQRYN